MHPIISKVCVTFMLQERNSAGGMVKQFHIFGRKHELQKKEKQHFEILGHSVTSTGRILQQMEVFA